VRYLREPYVKGLVSPQTWDVSFRYLMHIALWSDLDTPVYELGYRRELTNKAPENKTKRFNELFVKLCTVWCSC
jgi:hypothetical protein